MSLIEISRALARAVDELHFGAPVTHVYNPLVYARVPHEAYLERYGQGRREVVLVGMNPGPFGMAQTGVPFGDVGMVRDWMGIDGRLGKPPHEHPKRPVLGFSSTRAEVSGTRLWSWARDRFGTPKRFFARFFVSNYCPLVFMEASGRNCTPDKLAKRERELLYAVCDQALRQTVEALRPRIVVGVGAFAAKRASVALSGLDVEVGTMLHPSPASPKANQGWAEHADADLRALGVALP
ncbi:uracil-DNA glycosylase family protein [Haliangium sp.]|uniref:uracil-DNA glycosylase family protein n=1 Tax=Haliangium sp. TaxID=2663208 RepID=UPI003D134BCC